MNPRGEQPLSRHLALVAGVKQRLDIERRVLAAAFRSSFERGDTTGAALAHKGLCAILQTQISDGDATSTGSLAAGKMSPLPSATVESPQPGTIVETEADAGVGRKAYVSGTRPALSPAPAQPGEASNEARAVVSSDRTPSGDESMRRVDELGTEASEKPKTDLAGEMPDLSAVQSASCSKPVSKAQPLSEQPVSAGVPAEIEPAEVEAAQQPAHAAGAEEDKQAEQLSAERPTKEELEAALDLLECELTDVPDHKSEARTIKKPIPPTLVDIAVTHELLKEVKQVAPEEIAMEEFTFSFSPDAAEPEQPQTFCYVEEEPQLDESDSSSATRPDSEQSAADEALLWPEEVTALIAVSSTPQTELQPPPLPVQDAPATPPPVQDSQAAPPPVQDSQAAPPPLPPQQAALQSEPQKTTVQNDSHNRLPTPPAQRPPRVTDNVSVQSTSYAGRISQALERLTSSLPPGSLPPAQPPANEAEHEPVAGAASVPQLQPVDTSPVLSMPVLETPMFHAPPPQLELEMDKSAAAQSNVPMSSQPLESVPPVTVPSQTDSDVPPSPEAVAEMLAASGAPPPISQPMTPSQLIRTQTYYQILGVNKLSSYEEIHAKFWRLIRRVVRTRFSSRLGYDEVRELKEVLKAICVAHDVLMDPVTRTDYDLRQLGMRADVSGAGVETPADAPQNASPRTRLMIGELLECANILDRTELQIALDMHKAEPGTMFGTFLVKAGFLNPEELDSALVGQRLISSGKLTVAQFQTAMFRMRDHGTAFFDTLLVEGWVTPSEMLDEVNRQQKSGAAPGTPPPAHLPPAPPQQTPPADGATDGGSGGHVSAEHAAVVAAARNAENDLNAFLKTGELPEEKSDG